MPTNRALETARGASSLITVYNIATEVKMTIVDVVKQIKMSVTAANNSHYAL